MIRPRFVVVTAFLVAVGTSALPAVAYAFDASPSDPSSDQWSAGDDVHGPAHHRHRERSPFCFWCAPATSEPDPAATGDDGPPAAETTPSVPEQAQAAESEPTAVDQQSGAGGPAQAASSGGLDVRLTGYGWWDNTPPGSSEISDPTIHSSAGGTGTYDDPVTVAVPYHCQDGCLQWPAGTRFYVPTLQRYLIVEDTCGDNGADSCDDTNGNHLDVWVGGQSLSHDESDACEEGITGDTTAIENPAPGLAVTAGDICG